MCEVDRDEDDLSLFDGDERPTVSLERAQRHTDRWWLRTRWVVVAFGVVVLAGLGIGIAVFNASAPDRARGERTPQLAAAAFVHAIQAGRRDEAAELACAEFADEARAIARSGVDPGISFRLVGVSENGKDDARARFTERIDFGGGDVQSTRYEVTLRRGGGRWLVCGRS